MLDCEKLKACETLGEVIKRYPIVITRDLRLAKKWIRDHARGNERYGLVASSKAHRLKPYAIDIRVPINPVHWFLNGRNDTRSSYYLEDAATEFQVQGLELDWVCVTWDGDLRFSDSGWLFTVFGEIAGVLFEMPMLRFTFVMLTVFFLLEHDKD